MSNITICHLVICCIPFRTSYNETYGPNGPFLFEDQMQKQGNETEYTLDELTAITRYTEENRVISEKTHLVIVKSAFCRGIFLGMLFTVGVFGIIHYFMRL